MTNPVKVALILAAAMVISVGIYVYFSPFQSCVRSLMSNGWDEGRAKIFCLKKM